MFSSMPASSVPDLVAFQEVGSGRFESIHKAEANSGGMNTNKSAFGGCTMAFGVNAAHATVSGPQRLYSAMGNFVRPASTERKLIAAVEEVRNTRSFATRLIRVFQKQDDGQEHLILVMLADFQTPEQFTLLDYSAKPSMKYSPPAASWSDAQAIAFARQKAVPPAVEKAFEHSYREPRKYFDRLWVPESFGAQTFGALMTSWPTTQDHLDITEKAQSLWVRTRKPLASHRKSCSNP